MQEREKFSSRLGFILISAGCAIGLGNVWRFPFITGLYGGGAFVLLYLLFLMTLGIPVMVMEFAVGRASQKSVAKSFHVLEPEGSKWHVFSWFAMAGNYLLMMFYTTVAGWMLAYLYYMIKGTFVNKTPDEVGAIFGALLGNPGQMIMFMVIMVVLGFGVCVMGVQKGVERITKYMMSSLFLVLIVLVIRAVTLPGAGEGLLFYLKPNLAAMREQGIGNAIYAAMGQSFFTLSIGMGSMAIFGSYLKRDRGLLGESINITILDTTVALLSGLIIFPACFAFGVQPDAGPSLVFITLPNIFNVMPAGRLWGTLFFVFMTFAAWSTVIAVFENIIAFAMDLFGCTRRKAVVVNFFLIVLLSLPCALGFNVLSGFAPLGEGSAVLDLEDFLVSNCILPIGSAVYVLFCVSRYGWGWNKFIGEANAGAGIKFPTMIRGYLLVVVPAVILIIFFMGLADKLKFLFA